MTEAARLFGTDAPRTVAVPHAVGPLSFEWVEGGLRAIRFHGVEVLRAITFPVRDRDWGTIAPALSEVRDRREDETLHLAWTASWESGGARLRAEFEVEAWAAGLVFRARAVPDAPFETNRAGFTLLHPGAASGCPVTLEHSDGTCDETHMPELIDPWQPFMDIRAISHQQDGVTATCRMAGDTFEMEDQRQWSDASFKTYNRPLAKPWPYLLPQGEPLEQSVRLELSGLPTARAPADAELRLEIGAVTEARLPELALVVTPEEARAALADPGPLRQIAPQRITGHLDPGAGATDPRPAAELARALGAALDIEYAATCGGDLDAEFADLARRLDGLAVVSLLVCPSVDRQSTPPGSEWPDCPPLEEIHAAVARAFPDLPRGGGMLSYFTEFNRKRPPVAMLDFVSHGTNPIVHAADDLSVMQTLTALPWILRSGRAIAGDKPYRLGLSSIPMGQNPYGSRTFPNPDAQRICMADSDPRHHAQFGAAYTLGYLATISPFRVEVWTPAAGAGPRGVTMEGGAEDRTNPLSPLGQLLADLAPHAGAMVHEVTVSDPERFAALATSEMLWIANLTDGPLEVSLSSGETVRLDGYGVCRRGRSG